MSEVIVETIYVGHDNAVELELTEDGSPAVLSGVTKIVVDLGPVEFSSDDFPTLITWAGSVVTLKLGTIPAVALLSGSLKARIILFSPTNPNGIVWLDSHQIKFKIKTAWEG